MYKSESFLLFLLLLLLLFLFLLPFLLLPFLLHSLDAVFNGDKLGAYPVTHFCVCLEYPEDYQLDDFGDYQLFHGVLGDALKFPELFVVQCYGQVEFFAILCEFFKMLAKIVSFANNGRKFRNGKAILLFFIIFVVDRLLPYARS